MLTIFAAAAADGPGPADVTVSPAWWIAFTVIVVGLILLDLLVFNKEAHEISISEAMKSTIFWIGIGLAFGVAVWVGVGTEAGVQYFTGYLIEKSLSVDNVFVWAVILGYFGVPKAYQHRVLFWGIFGALLLRTIFVFAGVALLEKFIWLLLVFGAFLVFTGIRVATHSGGEVHPEKNPVLKVLRKRIAMTNEYHGAAFFIKEQGKRLATPMFAVLVLVEATDVVFAVDSIPAILAISHSQFIVLSSNAFAILGLRALFFVLAGYQDRLVHLNKGLGIILVYVGIKMLLSFVGNPDNNGDRLDLTLEPLIDHGHVNVAFSLVFIAVVLAVTVWISLKSPPADHPGEGAGSHIPGSFSLHGKDKDPEA